MYYFSESLLLTFLAINTYTDIKKKKISIMVSVIFFIVGMVLTLVSKEHTLVSVLGGLGVGALLILMGKISRQAVGFGDGIIFLVTGLYLGFVRNLVLLLYGLVICALASIIFLVIRKFKMKDKIPFAPFILTSFIMMLIMGV